MKGINLLSRHIQIALYSCTLLTSTALAREVTFSTDILNTRGISKNIANYFAEEPRFLPGVHSVLINVNGSEKGSLGAKFDEQGQLCVDDDFLTAIGLRPLGISLQEHCHDLQKDYPSAVIKSLPGKEMLELTVPPDALENSASREKNYSHGGSAGLLNYSLFSTRNEYNGGDSHNYTQGDLEAGANLANWALRSRYFLLDSDGDRSAKNLFTYGEHVFEAQQMRVQVGQISSRSALFSGTSLSGIQLLPESSMTSDNSGVTVTGIARTNQARVEVRQAGQLVYSTLVNAGAFRLDNVPILLNNADLQVSIVETDNVTTSFIVPASSLNLNGLPRPQGLMMSVGQVRNVDSDYSDPWVYNISDGWRLTPQTSLLAAGVLAEDYQASGAMLEWSSNEKWQVFASLLGSRESFGDTRSGIKAEIQNQLTLPGHVSVGVSTARYSDDYRELSEAMDDDSASYQSSYSANVNWSGRTAGTFSLAYSYNQATDDYEDSSYVSLSWGKTFKYASINVNWQHSVSNDNDNDDINDDNYDDDVFYINLNIPFQSQSINAYMRNQGDRTTYGLRSSGPLSDNTSYSVSADRDIGNDLNTLNGNINSNLHYTQMSVGATTNNDDQRTYSAMLSGGIALHRQGVTFSPYTIKDTFGIAHLSEPESGIEIATPQGPVWTDFWGQAVVPGLTEWRKSRIEVNANTLPQNMDLANGTKLLVPAHATVSDLDFNVLNTRRVMLKIKQQDGSWLPKGTSVVDEKGNYLVSAVDSGRVFISNIDETPTLYSVDDNMNRICKITYTLSNVQNKEAFYETAEGICQ
ncbi:TPA: fimbrial biogenesis outer membrane usher protein [Citrobacter koseri]|uniref:fimbrial biogenesis outer membrane usher protein n=1 Tax=Citrobacter koseri TaxID=545 RepID=UPI001A30D562|nr:fimbrial biogenesis outer membrane usher protein [Citrobacter koseri]HDQ2604654.1 fimbrial biogenesis outer membrane usher protein [Citrobacter koseri]